MNTTDKKRKYYKSNLSVDADKITVEFVCPNTKEKTSMKLEEYDISGYEDRLGCNVNAYIKCKKCDKNHTIYLRNG